VFGSWSSFGNYAEACDVDPFADRNEMKRIYGSVIVPNKASSSEVDRYMSEMYPIVREVSKFYIQSRKPSASAAEVKAFQDAIFALVHQESFWSHYRNTNSSNLKMIRGDVGHGHGIMQVDDRSHYVSLNAGAGANLGIHFAYALDIYYEAWQAAPSKSCVPSPTNWLSRTRAAYSAYNGGMGSICRFTNSSSKWAKNDRNFLDKFNKRQWLNSVANVNKPASINIACLSQGKESCPSSPAPTPNPPSEPSQPSPPTQQPAPPSSGEMEFSKNVFYQNSNGLFCAFEDNRLLCLPDYRDAACLNGMLKRNIQKTVDFSSNYKTVPIEVLDRNRVCADSISGLAKIGDSVRLLKSINLRKTPAGALLTTVPDNRSLQVLDFEVKNDNSQTRYYKVTYGSKTGYIYAGSRTSQSDWTSKSASDKVPKYIADVGDSIIIKNEAGINQRQTAGGALIQRIPKETRVEVWGVHLSGSSNSLYYYVDFRGAKGFIYAGQGHPSSTYASWVEIDARAPESPTFSLAKVSDSVYYENLMSCTSEACVKSEDFVPGPKLEVPASERVLEVLQITPSGWSQVRHQASGKTGWIQSQKLEAI